LIASKEGGVEIETVPHDKIIVEPISVKNGLTDDIMKRVIHKLDLGNVKFFIINYIYSL
jgi:succinyl-CoA synthetase beta subunit